MAYPQRMAPGTEWTAEQVRGLPDDGGRYELIDGTLHVTPAPSWGHQRIVRRLLRALERYVEEHGLGEVHVAPADIEFSPRRLVEPDVFVVPPRADGGRAESWEEVRRLLLVVEVLSPSTARVDRGAKRRMYLDEGVPEYWIVDPVGGYVERWRSGEERPEVLDETLVWQPRGDVEGLVLGVAELVAGG